jgi:CspA family cold shock protein
MKGRVVFFSSGRGYGFIAPDNGGAEIFAHYTEICADGYKTLERGSTVEFEVGTSTKNNKPMAKKIRQIGATNGSNSTTAR